MEPLNGLLLWGGETVQFCWSAMVAAVEWSFHSMAWLLNPLLSPVLSILNPVFTVLGNLVFGVFSFLPRWLGLSVLSVALGIVMVPCFGFLSNQRGISRAKDDIKANLLALKLFKDDLGVAFRCQGRILWAILRLQRYVLVPILCLALPVTMTLGRWACDISGGRCRSGSPPSFASRSPIRRRTRGESASNRPRDFRWRSHRSRDEATRPAASAPCSPGDTS